MPASNATSRFSDRVENYVRYRPGYPADVIEALKAECGLFPTMWLPTSPRAREFGHACYWKMATPSLASSPMQRCVWRASGCWQKFPKFTSIVGTAEATTLTDQSVDFVTAAQAAHWFDRERARREFVRILKPGGWLVLLWNERLTDSTSFSANTNSCC